MKRIKNKLLMILSSGLLLIAIQAVNKVSYNHIFQNKEPNCLKKYNKY